jgi:hypothetical protein
VPARRSTTEKDLHTKRTGHANFEDKTNDESNAAAVKEHVPVLPDGSASAIAGAQVDYDMSDAGDATAVMPLPSTSFGQQSALLLLSLVCRHLSLRRPHQRCRRCRRSWASRPVC